jgi:NTP pyrophosphatase (non-canonical NTP hydrolase)
MDKKYIEAVLTTESANDPHTGKPFTQEKRWQHAIMGIITELGELMDIYKKHLFYGKPIDQEHLVEELGDLFWYIGLGADAAGWGEDPELREFLLPAPAAKEGQPTPILLLKQALYFASCQTLTKDSTIGHIYTVAWLMVAHLGLDYQDILDKNVAKLKERYGGKFTSEAAINRDVDAEYDAMRVVEGQSGA